MNRVIRVFQNGWEWHADPRHAELILEELGVSGSKGVVSPGGEMLNSARAEPLDEQGTQRLRSLAACARYLAADRPDLQYIVKELCRDMTNPTSVSWDKLQQVGKFLASRPRLVWRYIWEAAATEVDGFSDSNWGGCTVSRNIFSGGAVVLGSHLIRTWAKTQSTIALSSAEAKLFGGVKTA